MVKQDQSIIGVIQRMVQEGQPREKILASLHDLGVNDDQSKRLLLIAEADTFTLLKKEIGTLVRAEFDSQKSDIDELIRSEIHKMEEAEKSEVSKIASVQLKDVRDNIVNESKDFEGRVNRVIVESQKTVSLVKVALDSLSSRIAQLELDVEQMKVHKFRKKSMFFSYVMLSCGAVLFILVIALLLMNFKTLDMAQIVLFGMLILTSIAFMFASIVG